MKHPVPIETGPSPRVRGKRGLSERYSRGTGSIPARAGETFLRVRRPRNRRVHPRACGGNLQSLLSGSIPRGPSPRVRGKPGGYPNSPSGLGSIPARAGETKENPSTRMHAPVHPRACGGNVHEEAIRSEAAGPSPRVRGKPRHFFVGNVPVGSIPARAGETVQVMQRAGAIAVHPRACGGNVHAPHSHSMPLGPSPRVRGKLHAAQQEAAGGRSIPARAGETSADLPGVPCAEVHPRACGGNRLIPLP